MRKHTAPICAGSPQRQSACNRAMMKVQSGIVIDCVLPDGRSYYKVHADLWRCAECGSKVYDSFGNAIENFVEGYEAMKTDVKVRIE